MSAVCQLAIFISLLQLLQLTPTYAGVTRSCDAQIQLRITFDFANIGTRVLKTFEASGYHGGIRKNVARERASALAMSCITDSLRGESSPTFQDTAPIGDFFLVNGELPGDCGSKDITDYDTSLIGCSAFREACASMRRNGETEVWIQYRGIVLGDSGCVDGETFEIGAVAVSRNGFGRLTCSDFEESKHCRTA